MRAALLWLTVIAASLLSSCGLQERIDERSSEPKRLDSSPETTGLLVVDVDLNHQGSLTFGLTTSIRVIEGTIRRAETREPLRQGSLRAKLVVFQLRPGTYELVSVRGHFSTGTPQQPFYHTVEPFLATEVGPIAVTAGQIAYVGKLTATGHSRLGQLGLTYSYRWDRDPAREAEALSMIEQHYKDTPWMLLLRNRLDSLGQRS